MLPTRNAPSPHKMKNYHWTDIKRIVFRCGVNHKLPRRSGWQLVFWVRWESNGELHIQVSRAPAAAPKQHAMQPDSLIAMDVQGSSSIELIATGLGIQLASLLADGYPMSRLHKSCSWNKIIGQCTTLCRLFTCIYAAMGCPLEVCQTTITKINSKLLGLCPWGESMVTVQEKKSTAGHFQMNFFFSNFSFSPDGDIAEVQLVHQIGGLPWQRRKFTSRIASGTRVHQWSLAPQGGHTASRDFASARPSQDEKHPDN